eukprot:3925567-Ditylum_brightwellii.AAC.1
MAHQLIVESMCVWDSLDLLESMYVGFLRSVMTQQILMYLLRATGQEAQRKWHKPGTPHTVHT